MPTVDCVVESPVSRSPRARQLEGMFDVPPKPLQRIEWKFDAPIEAQPWNVGLIVGPSGSGKTTIARHLFPNELSRSFSWNGKGVIDDFAESHSIADVANICQSVGFNTIPAWMRPYSVLSNGEKFRVDIARRLLEFPDPIVVDEFTSVVDRQVAQIASHAIQKYVRAANRRFVAVSCHYDIIDWLQPDWIIEPASGTFRRRSLQRRPPIEVEIRSVPYEMWSLFAPFHYLTADLNKAARCFALFVNNAPAAFAGVLPRPNKQANIRGISRVVTLPDYQGLGLAFVLMDTLAAAHKAMGYRLRMYPAHPAFVRAFDRSKSWRLDKMPGEVKGFAAYVAPDGRQYGTLGGPKKSSTGGVWKHGINRRNALSKRRVITGILGGGKQKDIADGGEFSRPCAVFEYIGEAMTDKEQAYALIGSHFNANADDRDIARRIRSGK